MRVRTYLHTTVLLCSVLAAFAALPTGAAVTFVCKFASGAQDPLFVRIDKMAKKISWSRVSNPKAQLSCSLRELRNTAIASCQTRFIPKNYDDDTGLTFFEQMDRITLQEKESGGVSFDKTGHMEIYTLGINRYSLAFYHDSHLRLHARRKGERKWLDLSGLNPRLSVIQKSILAGKPRGQCRLMKGEIQAKF